MPNIQTLSLIKFGSHLKKLRMNRKMSLKKMALLCGIPEDEVIGYETGSADIPLLTMVRMATALQVKLWELIDY